MLRVPVLSTCISDICLLLVAAGGGLPALCLSPAPVLPRLSNVLDVAVARSLLATSLSSEIASQHLFLVTVKALLMVHVIAFANLGGSLPVVAGLCV